ncbi:MAG TPA: NTP transferase domain-containing protein [Ignavibacteria bacterium]|jgi:CTP:molybdopterin cytidylyltransferase MocA
MDRVAAIILAGGRSIRFGTPKPFLKNNNSITFLEGLVNVYLEFGCTDIILVLNQNLLDAFTNIYTESFRSKIKVVYNNKTELGRFYSLKLGVHAAPNSNYCFVQNIDNPFTDSDTLRKLYHNRKADAYISPVYLNKGGHPILLSRMIIEMIRKETKISLNTKEFLYQFNKKTVEVENDKISANINTPEDYFREFHFSGNI